MDPLLFLYKNYIGLPDNIKKFKRETITRDISNIYQYNVSIEVYTITLIT